MDVILKELLISRIISGCLRCKINKKIYYLRQPNRIQRYRANQLYYNTYQSCLKDKLYTDTGLLEFMVANGLWDYEKEDLFQRVPKDIEDFKVALYRALFDEQERNAVRKLLNNAKSKQETLFTERNQFNHMGARGTALIARSRYLIGASLRHSNGKPYFTSKDFWKSSDSILEKVAAFLTKCNISEEEYREIARTEPWQSYYRVDKSFGMPGVDLTEEQRTLLAWSSLYTSVESHHECPPRRVIEDNDALDGWLIEQRRKHEGDLDKAAGDSFIKNDTIRNSDEIFVMAKSKADRDRVHELNDEYGLMMKKMKMDYLKKKGTVEEKDMPDQRMKKMEQMGALAKGGK